MATDSVSAKAAAREATRLALLEAAAQMLFESPAADPLGALRPMHVVRRAVPPRSSGAFYNIWSSQSQFRRELLRYVLSPERTEAGPDTLEAAADLLTSQVFSLEETFRVVANLNFHAMQDDTALRLKQALWTRHSEDPELRDLLAGLYAGVTAMLTPMYSALLARSGRRTCSPYTVEHLAAALTGLAEGVYTRWAIQPAATPDSLGGPPAAVSNRDRDWTFFAATAYTLFIGLTEPCPRSLGGHTPTASA